MRTGQFNFSKGEISEELIARVDVSSYQSAVRTARNVLVLKYGGLTKRPGMRFVAEAYDAAHPVRLFPFQFSLTQAYALELGQYYMRPAALGGLVLEDALKVTAITKAANALVTAAYHGYSVGDQVYFQKITGMVEINGMTGTVMTTPSANTFTVNINTTGFSTFVSSDGLVRTGPPTPPPAPPPPPPPPAPPPSPPPTTGGGGYLNDDPRGGSIQVLCVAVDTPIQIAADGTEKAAGDLTEGEFVYAPDEFTGEWGLQRVLAIRIAEKLPVLALDIEGRRIRATPEHRFQISGEWRTITELGGIYDGFADVVKMTTASGTYVSAGVVSHNTKYYQ